jgi:hypothetical protein
MLVNSLLVERVDLRRLGRSTGGPDLLGDDLDWFQGSPRQEERGSFAREGAGDGTANGTAGSVDHRNLVFQHHRRFLSVEPSTMQTPRPVESWRSRPPSSSLGRCLSKRG